MTTAERRATAGEPDATTDLLVGGMTCAACVGRVEKKLGRVEGVTATVNLATGRARVSHPASVTAEQLISVVERAGYTAELPPPAEEQHADAARERRKTGAASATWAGC